MNKFTVIIFLTCLTFTLPSVAASKGNIPAEKAKKDPYVTLVEQLAKYANRFKGVPYVWGGTKPSGFDCSGFVRYVFAKFDMPLVHSSRQLSEIGYEVDTRQAFVGDLIFFSSSRKAGSPIGHVGIIVSNDDNGIKFIHASTSQGVTYSYLSERYYAERFVGVKRVIDALKDF